MFKYSLSDVLMRSIDINSPPSPHHDHDNSIISRISVCHTQSYAGLFVPGTPCSYKCLYSLCGRAFSRFEHQVYTFISLIILPCHSHRRSINQIHHICTHGREAFRVHPHVSNVPGSGSAVVSPLKMREAMICQKTQHRTTGMEE